MRILCVAEKPSISKAVAGHLAGGDVQTANTRLKHIKNYQFNFDFGQPWGQCAVTMTCVVGHLTNLEFPPEFKDWKYPPPDRLFGAPVQTTIPDVSKSSVTEPTTLALVCRWQIIHRADVVGRTARIRSLWRGTSSHRQSMLVLLSSGRIVISRASSLGTRYARLQEEAIRESR